MTLENSKIAELLISLSDNEIKNLENYIRSPFFNNSRQLTEFFELLMVYHPCYEKLKKTEIFEKLYPTEAYSDKKVRDILYRMLKLCEDFLSQLEFLKNNLLQSRFTIQQLSSRNLEKHFTAKIRETERELEKETNIGSDYLFSKYSVYSQKRNFLEMIENVKKRVIYYGDLGTEINLFTVYTVYTILKYEINNLSSQKDLKFSLDFKILDYILNFIKENDFSGYPIIDIYYNIILLNRNGEDLQRYLNLKELIDKNVDKFSEEDRLIVLVEQFNFTKVQSLKGTDFYRKENYRILKQNTDKGIYPKEGKYFASTSFINIVTMAAAKKDFEWIESFLNKYTGSIEPELQKPILTFLRGIINYHQGNYGEALKYLAKVSTSDPHQQSKVKINQLRIYFEIGEFERVLSTVDAFKHFLSSVKYFPDFIRERYINFSNFLNRLTNAVLSENQKTLFDIKRDILAINPETLENKIWLLAQIDKFLK
jgi:hypothetical protein